MSQQEVHYSDYLQLDKILNAQFPESDKRQLPAHDEMLFIVIHQAYELWFKQLLHEVDSVADIMQKPSLNDNSPELQTVVHRLSRMVTILRVLVHQIDVMESMTAMDFLDFRDMLRPASGFQSWQFKALEAKLGLRYQHRHAQEYYISQLRQEHIDIIKQAEKEKSLIQLLNTWLERMPFFEETENWKNYKPVTNATADGAGIFIPVASLMLNKITGNILIQYLQMHLPGKIVSFLRRLAVRPYL
jgi:tryptophan 2,3-dioxygenase